MGRSPWLCTSAETCIRQHSGCNQIACYMDSVGPLCVCMLLYSICVCSTDSVNEHDRMVMVYCRGVITFLGESGVKRAEIADCSSRMDPLLDRIYQCFCCSILARRDEDFSTTSSFNAAKYALSFYVVSSAVFSFP